MKVIETSETWNREKLQHDGNLNVLWQLFPFFSFWNRSRSGSDWAVSESAGISSGRESIRDCSIRRSTFQAFQKRFFIVSSSGLGKSIRFFAMLAPSSRFSIFSSTCSKDGRDWLQWIILSAFRTTYSIWLRTRKTLARQLFPLTETFRLLSRIDNQLFDRFVKFWPGFEWF